MNDQVDEETKSQRTYAACNFVVGEGFTAYFCKAQHKFSISPEVIQSEETLDSNYWPMEKCTTHNKAEYNDLT